jgi:hypothetical protein
MIRTVIIDDEPRSIKLVAGMIDRYCPSLTLAAQLTILLKPFH